METVRQMTNGEEGSLSASNAPRSGNNTDTSGANTLGKQKDANSNDPKDNLW